MSTIIKSGIKKIDYNGIIPTGRDTRYYQSELTVTGIKPNRNFSIDLYSSDSKDMGLAIQIGTIDPKTGVLTLNPEPADPPTADERLYKSVLWSRTKNPGTYWEAKISEVQHLRDLANKEKEELGLATGNVNVSTETGSTGVAVTTGGNVAGQNGKNAQKFEYNLTNTTIDVSIGGRRFRKQYGHFSYPEDLRTNKQDRVRFTQKYTEGTKIDATITSGERNFQRKIKKVRGSVTLPVVTGIEDTSAVDWNDGKLNPIQALAGASALGIFQQVRQSGDIADAFRTAAGSLNKARMDMEGQVGGDVQSAIQVYLAQQAVGTQGLLSRTTGAILNPNLELLFGGPKLRSFGFSFKLSARDAKEADQIRKIIRFFKQGMSVKTSSSNVFLKAPNVFDIQYQTFNTDGTEIVHPSINIIKTCALTSCNIQYTPDGTYMTYEDPYRTLTSYQLTMQFSELDPIYDSDYSELDKDKDQVIGY